MHTSADIVSVEVRLTSTRPVQIIALEADSTEFSFAAGQYVQISHPDGENIPLSVASGPHRLPELILHYRSTPGVVQAELMDELLASSTTLSIEGPFGDVHLNDRDTRNLLIVAGGTGVSQALSITDELHAINSPRNVVLVVCADHKDDFYFSEVPGRPEKLETVLIADPRRDATNQALGWIREHAPSFQNWRIVLAGPPDFVYAAGDVFAQTGVSIDRTESDVYAYAPRAKAKATPARH